MSAPPRIFDRPALTRCRGRTARQYAAGQITAPDFLLHRVAEDFSERLSAIKRTFASALDLGCHHGVLGVRLARDHGIAGITYADECATMLAHTPSPRLQIDLEHLPLAEAGFDLIVSGLALQTINDLPGTLAQVQAALRPDGLFMAAVIGGSSLTELRESFLIAETEITGGASPRVAPAIDVRDLGTLLQRANFALPVVDSDVVTVTYTHPLALMRELRAMGATNVLAERRRTCLRRDILARAIEIYQLRFAVPDGRIRATFEILTATAWAPHASQQKPLKPGSATARLADALGRDRTKELEQDRNSTKIDHALKLGA